LRATFVAYAFANDYRPSRLLGEPSNREGFRKVGCKRGHDLYRRDASTDLRVVLLRVLACCSPDEPTPATRT